jgi:hypothetical protein
VTYIGQSRRLRRAVLILREHIRRDMIKRPWLYVGLALAYIPIRLLVEVL